MGQEQSLLITSRQEGELDQMKQRRHHPEHGLPAGRYPGCVPPALCSAAAPLPHAEPARPDHTQRDRQGHVCDYS